MVSYSYTRKSRALEALIAVVSYSLFLFVYVYVMYKYIDIWWPKATNCLVEPRQKFYQVYINEYMYWQCSNVCRMPVYCNMRRKNYLSFVVLTTKLLILMHRMYDLFWTCPINPVDWHYHVVIFISTLLLCRRQATLKDKWYHL